VAQASCPGLIISQNLSYLIISRGMARRGPAGSRAQADACAAIPLFLPFLGRGGGLHLAHGAGLPARAALLGFAAGFHFAAAFFTGKNGHEICLRNQEIIGRRSGLVRVASRASIPPHPALPRQWGRGQKLVNSRIALPRFSFFVSVLFGFPFSAP